MGTIPQELVTFKTTVEPGMSSMTAAVSILQDKLTEITTANNTAMNGVSSYYNSSNKEAILSKFTSMNEIYSKISTSLSSDLSGILSEAQALLDKIAYLEKLNEEIATQNAIISRESGLDDASNSRISAARSVISSKEAEFTVKANEATAALTSLKGKDASLSFVSEFTITDYTQKLGQLTGGTFTKETFKASNGVSIEYYVYVPQYGENVEGLPVHIYMHGSGETGSGVLNVGLPKMINNKTITPSGIVICPQAKSGSNFYDKKYQAALLELADKTAEKYNGDKNKLSISGHSMGAIAGYKLIANYPDRVAAFVPISGYGTMSEGIKNVKVWAFHGDRDSSVSYGGTKKLISELQRINADAELYTFAGKGHGNVQNYTFEQKYTNQKDGVTMNPLEWAFRQSLNKT